MPRPRDPAPRPARASSGGAWRAPGRPRGDASRRTLAWADARGAIVGARCELPIPRETRRAHARRRTLDLRGAHGRLAPHLRRRGAGRGGSASPGSAAAPEAAVGPRQPFPARVDRRRPVRPRLPPAPGIHPRPGRTVRARAGRGSRAVPSARPNEATVGALRLRKPLGGSDGDPAEDPPRDGGRDREHDDRVGAVRSDRRRPDGRAGRGVVTGARAATGGSGP